jgi:hypothetical protein
MARPSNVDHLTLFGLFAVTAMLVNVRPGEEEPLVRFGIRRILSARVRLRIPSGRMAVRAGGSDLGSRGGSAMVAGSFKIAFLHWAVSRRRSAPENPTLWKNPTEAVRFGI